MGKTNWWSRAKGDTIWGKHADEIAAPGLSRLAEDHARSKAFADKLRATPRSVVLTETQRVVKLPQVEYPTDDLTSVYAQPGGTWQLRPIQSQALAALADAKGGLFSIGVGWGKTLIGMLAGQAIGAKFTVFLAPASTIAQLENTHEELARQFKLGDMVFVSYGRLSRPDGTSLLEKYTKVYDPKDIVLVCDEVHKVKRKESARTKRVIRFLQAHPEVRFVGMSGTLTSKSLKDMGHIAEMALRENSPLPRNQNHLNAWSECIDVAGQPAKSDWKLVTPLWSAYERRNIFSVGYNQRRDEIRRAFQRRFRTSPGVVCSEAGALGCSLEIGSRPLEVPQSISEAMDMAIDEEATPNGDPFIDDSSQWRALRQLSAGFYYKWDWPDGEIDEDWVDARTEWNRCVRRELLYHSKEGYDSPLLVSNQIRREVEDGGRAMIHRAWMQWFGTGLSKQKAPPTLAVWIDDFLIQDAVAWANSQSENVILWYESRAVEEKLKEHGIVVYGAGTNPPKEGRTCGMSIRAHGVGKNLQHGWRLQLILEPPSSGTVWEQLLGRTHRPGQEADTVEVLTYYHTDAYRQAIFNAKDDASYIQDTTGSRQKLLYCVYTGALLSL